MANAPGYLFPILEPAVIIDTLGSFSIPIKPAQLKQPTTDFVLGTCEQLLRRVGFKDVDGLMPVADEGIVSLGTEYPEIYRRPLAKAFLVRKIGQIARNADVSDYSALFLSMPTPHRTAVILSALINYVAFCGTNCSRADYIKEQAEAVHEERKRVAKQLERESAAVEKLKAARAADMQREQELSAANTAAMLEIQRMAEEAERMKRLIEHGKADGEQLRQRIEHVVTETKIVSEQLSAMQSRIVQSPERKKRDITSMRTDVEDHRKAINTNEGKIRELQAKQAAFTSIERDIKACVEQLTVIERETAELSAAEKALADVRDQQERKHMDKNDLQLRKERAEQQRANAHERLERAKQAASDKKLSYAQKLARLKAEYEQLSIERKENDHEVAELVAESESIEREMATHLRESQEQLDALVDAYWDLREQHLKYMDSIEKRFFGRGDH